MNTHNSFFINNLALSLTKNKDLFVKKGLGTDTNYNAFMNSLANAMFKKEKMVAAQLPIIKTTIDWAKSTKYYMLLTQFESSFVTARYDSYYLAVVFDKKYNFRVFSYELDYDSNNNIIYSICEHTKEGKRIVIDTCEGLRFTKFGSVLFNVLK